MRKFLASLILFTFGTACADAAQIVLPSVVITMPGVASQTPVCTKTTTPLVAPVAAGTVVFSCVVPPSGWAGAVQFSGGSPFSVTPLSGNTFNVILSASITAATTFPAPGTITTLP